MMKVENDCCDCEAPGYPCVGESCPLRHCKHYYCDKCGEETDELYYLEDEELCEDCVLNTLKKVEVEK